ncbi:MAG: CocE/NonD family hydrolase [bacterium]
MKQTESGHYEVKQVEHCWIPVSDGIRLSARLWLPILPGDTPMPAILEYIPYRKRDMVRLRDERNHPVFARNGYACIRVDMRGSGDSEGVMTDMYGSKELDDAVEIIDWIADQPWCDGCVGMMGTSWGGTSALQTAARRSDALKAIVAVCATNNRYEDDIHHMGGCLLTDTVEWGATLPVILASPPDPQTVGPKWRELWMERLEALRFPLENWVRHEVRDEYWRWGSVNENPDAIVCPVLAIGGWSDRYSNTVMNFLKQGQDNCWGIVGPWGHHYPDQGCPGPAIGFQQEAIQWWDRWLKNVDNGIENHPRLRVWLQKYYTPQNKLSTRPGRWVHEEAWPSHNVIRTRLWISPEALHWEPSVTDATVTVPTAKIVGDTAGDTGYFGRDGGLPLDQQPDDQRSLIFESSPLEQPIELLGQISLKVAFSSNQPVSTLVARLNDVPPEGPVARVAYGVRNLALNDGLNEPLAGGTEEVVSCHLDFHNTAYQFETGHRIRLALSSTYWPMIWPSPVSANIMLTLSEMELQLPLRTAITDDTAISFADPVNPNTSASHVSVAEPPLTRSVGTETHSSRHSVAWHQPRRCIHFPDIDLNFETNSKARHTIEDKPPYKPSTDYEQELRYYREGWDIRIIGTARLCSTDTTYQLKGSVKVFENDQLIFERGWDPEIRRTVS